MIGNAARENAVAIMSVENNLCDPVHQARKEAQRLSRLIAELNAIRRIARGGEPHGR